MLQQTAAGSFFNQGPFIANVDETKCQESSGGNGGSNGEDGEDGHAQNNRKGSGSGDSIASILIPVFSLM